MDNLQQDHQKTQEVLPQLDGNLPPMNQMFYARSQMNDQEQQQFSIFNYDYKGKEGLLDPEPKPDYGIFLSEFQNLSLEDQQAIQIIRNAQNLAKNPLLKEHIKNLGNFNLSSMGSTKSRSNMQLMKKQIQQYTEERVDSSEYSLLKSRQPGLQLGELSGCDSQKKRFREAKTNIQTPVMKKKQKNKRDQRNRPWTSHNLQQDNVKGGNGKSLLLTKEQSTDQLLSMAQLHSKNIVNSNSRLLSRPQTSSKMEMLQRLSPKKKQDYENSQQFQNLGIMSQQQYQNAGMHFPPVGFTKSRRPYNKSMTSMSPAISNDPQNESAIHRFKQNIINMRVNTPLAQTFKMAGYDAPLDVHISKTPMLKNNKRIKFFPKTKIDKQTDKNLNAAKNKRMFVDIQQATGPKQYQLDAMMRSSSVPEGNELADNENDWQVKQTKNKKRSNSSMGGKGNQNRVKLLQNSYKVNEAQQFDIPGIMPYQKNRKLSSINSIQNKNSIHPQNLDSENYQDQQTGDHKSQKFEVQTYTSNQVDKESPFIKNRQQNYQSNFITNGKSDNEVQDFMAQRSMNKSQKMDYHVTSQGFNSSMEHLEILPSLPNTHVEIAKMSRLMTHYNKEDLRIPLINDPKQMQSLIESNDFKMIHTQNLNSQLDSIRLSQEPHQPTTTLNNHGKQTKLPKSQFMPKPLEGNPIKRRNVTNQHSMSREQVLPKKSNTVKDSTTKTKQSKQDSTFLPTDEDLKSEDHQDEEQILLDMLKQKLKDVRNKRSTITNKKKSQSKSRDEVIKQPENLKAVNDVLEKYMKQVSKQSTTKKRNSYSQNQSKTTKKQANTVSSIKSKHLGTNEARTVNSKKALETQSSKYKKVKDIYRKKTPQLCDLDSIKSAENIQLNQILTQNSPVEKNITEICEPEKIDITQVTEEKQWVKTGSSLEIQAYKLATKRQQVDTSTQEVQIQLTDANGPHLQSPSDELFENQLQQESSNNDEYIQQEILHQQEEQYTLQEQMQLIQQKILQQNQLRDQQQTQQRMHERMQQQQMDINSKQALINNLYQAQMQNQYQQQIRNQMHNQLTQPDVINLVNEDNNIEITSQDVDMDMQPFLEGTNDGQFQQNQYLTSNSNTNCQRDAEEYIEALISNNFNQHPIIENQHNFNPYATQNDNTGYQQQFETSHSANWKQTFMQKPYYTQQYPHQQHKCLEQIDEYDQQYQVNDHHYEEKEAHERMVQQMIRVNSRLIKQPRQEQISAQESLKVSYLKGYALHSDVMGVCSAPDLSMKEVSEKVMDYEDYQFGQSDLEGKELKMKYMSLISSIENQDEVKKYNSSKKLTQQELEEQEQAKLKKMKQCENQFKLLVSDQMHQNKQTMLQGNSFINEFKARNRLKENIGAFENKDKSSTPIDDQHADPFVSFKPANFFDGLPLTDDEDIDEQVPVVKKLKPRKKVQKRIIKSKALMNELEVDSVQNFRQFREDQFFQRIGTFISQNQDYYQHEGVSNKIIPTYSKSLKKSVFSSQKSQTSSMYGSTTYPTPIERMLMSKSLGSIQHLLKYINYYTRYEQNKLIWKHKKKLISQEVKEIPYIEKILKSYVVGVTVYQKYNQLTSKMRLHLFRVPKIKSIDALDINFIEIKQKNPPLYDDVDDSENIIEQQVCQINRKLQRHFKNRHVTLQHQANKLIIINKYDLNEREVLELYRKKHNKNDNDANFYLFNSYVKNKVQEKVQEKKDLFKVEEFMKYQDITWKNKHYDLQFINLENPNKLSSHKIINSICLLDVKTNTHMQKIYGQIDWQLIQDREEYFSNKQQKQNSSLYHQKINYSINKFLKTKMENEYKNISSYVKITTEKLSNHIECENFQFKNRSMPIQVKLKKAYILKKLLKFVNQNIFDLRYNGLISYMKLNKKPVSRLEEVIDMHDKFGKSTSIRSYLAWQMIQCNDALNVNKIIFGENGHSLFLKLYSRKNRQIDFHILLTRIIKNLHETVKKETQEVKDLRNLKIYQKQQLFEIRRKVVMEGNRSKSLEYGIPTKRYIKHLQLKNTMFKNATDMNFNRKIQMMKMTAHKIQLTNQEEFQKLLNVDFQSLYDDENEKEQTTPLIRNFKRQNATDHYNKNYRNFVLSTYLEPLAYRTKDNINMYYKQIEFNREYDPEQRHEIRKTAYNFGYKCQLSRDPKNLIYVFEIYVPTLIDKACTKIQDYENFMRSKKETKNDEISKQIENGGSKYRAKTIVNNEIEQIINVADFETDEDMRDVKFSDYSSSNSSNKSSTNNQKGKRRNTLKDPSVLQNIIKGKLTIIFNPYEHYQNMKVQKLKDMYVKNKNFKEKKIYSSVGQDQLSNQIDIQKSNNKDNQAIINRIINQARVQVSKDNHDDIVQFREKGKGYYKKVKKQILNKDQLKNFEKSQHYAEMMQHSQQKRESQKKARTQPGTQPGTQPVSGRREGLQMETQGINIKKKYDSPIQCQTEQQNSPYNKNMQPFNIQEDSGDDSSPDYQGKKEMSKVSFTSSCSSYQTKSKMLSQDDRLSTQKDYKNQQQLQQKTRNSLLEKKDSRIDVLLPQFKLLFKEDKHHKKSVSQIIQNTATDKETAQNLSRSNDRLLRKIVNIDKQGKIIKLTKIVESSSSYVSTDSQPDHAGTQFQVENELDMIVRYQKKNTQKRGQMIKTQQKETLKTLIQKKDTVGIEVYNKINEQMKRYEYPQGKMTQEQFVIFNKKLNISKQIVYVKNKIGIDFKLPEMVQHVEIENENLNNSIIQAQKQKEELGKIMGKYIQIANFKLKNAVIAQQYAKVREIMDRFQVDYEKKDKLGNNLVVIAAMMKDLEMLKILMTKQFNVNHKNYDGNTALHYACAMSCQKVIDFLISKGAREDIENSLGQTCWQML